MTIRQLAKLAGVSTATVVRALHNSPYVRPETRQKILELAELYAYQPRVQLPVAEKAEVVGCLIPDVSSLHFSRVLKGVLEEAFFHSTRILTLETHHNVVHSQKALDVLIEQKVGGIIAACGHIHRIPGEVLFRLLSHGIHVVAIDNVPFDDSPPIDLVQTDYAALALEMVKYLYNLGHRAIAYVAPLYPAGAKPPAELGYFKQAMKRLQIPTPYFIDTFPFASHFEVARHIMHLSPAPTAVIAASDIWGARIMQGFHYEGWQVPRDISVLGCSNLGMSDYLTPGLTTFERHLEDIGRQAMRLLNKRLQEGDAPLSHKSEVIRVQSKLLVRESCTRPRAAEAHEARVLV